MQLIIVQKIGSLTPQLAFACAAHFVIKRGIGGQGLAATVLHWAHIHGY
jgi:hypothetical protein